MVWRNTDTRRHCAVVDLFKTEEWQTVTKSNLSRLGVRNGETGFKRFISIVKDGSLLDLQSDESVLISINTDNTVLLRSSTCRVHDIRLLSLSNCALLLVARCVNARSLPTAEGKRSVDQRDVPRRLLCSAPRSPACTPPALLGRKASADPKTHLGTLKYKNFRYCVARDVQHLVICYITLVWDHLHNSTQWSVESKSTRCSCPFSRESLSHPHERWVVLYRR